MGGVACKEGCCVLKFEKSATCLSVSLPATSSPCVYVPVCVCLCAVCRAAHEVCTCSVNVCVLQ